MSKESSDPIRLFGGDLQAITILVPSAELEEWRALAELTRGFGKSASIAEMVRRSFKLYLRAYLCLRAGKPIICVKCGEDIVLMDELTKEDA